MTRSLLDMASPPLSRRQLAARYIRRARRALFCSAPRWLDGPYVTRRMQQGATWEGALAERERMNVIALLRWREGDADWDRDLQMQLTVACITPDGQIGLRFGHSGG